MTKLIVFKATGEVRRAKKNDWFRYHMSGDYSQWVSQEPTNVAYPIYTRHEIPATPDVLKVLGMEE